MGVKGSELTIVEIPFKLLSQKVHLRPIAVVRQAVLHNLPHVRYEFRSTGVHSIVELGTGGGEVHGFLDDGEVAVGQRHQAGLTYSGALSRIGSTGFLNNTLDLLAT